MKYTFRYRDQLYAGGVAEKDAGEPFAALHNRYGYDYYSFYLLLQNCGRLKSLAVGNYRLSFGQGLVMSTDYLMGKTIYASSFNNRSAGNLVFLSPFLPEKRSDANDRHNLSLNYRNDFHEYYTWNNLLVPVHKVG